MAKDEEVEWRRMRRFTIVSYFFKLIDYYKLELQATTNNYLRTFYRASPSASEY